MGILAKETRALQNPALGAVLLWKFAEAYYEASATHDSVPMPLLFLVLPMVFYEPIRSVILSTRRGSGLRAFAEKFSSSRLAQADLVLSLQSRVSNGKKLTMESLQLMIRCGMASIDSKSGYLIPSKKRGFNQRVPGAIDPLVRASEYLGAWMSGLSVYEAAVTLRLFF